MKSRRIPIGSDLWIESPGKFKRQNTISSTTWVEEETDRLQIEVLISPI
jgi:hypothetical protein